MPPVDYIVLVGNRLDDDLIPVSATGSKPRDTIGFVQILSRIDRAGVDLQGAGRAFFQGEVSRNVNLVDFKDGINPSGTVSVTYGANQTFTISANSGYHIVDVLVDGRIVCELKSVELITPLFMAQIPAQLKLVNLHMGFLINFNVALIKEGIRRVIV